MTDPENEFGLIAKKHWFCYVPFVLLAAFGIFLGIGASDFFQLAGLALFIYSGWKILSFKSVTWMLNDSGLYITSGLLPWNRTQWHIPYADIYESFVSFGMFGYFLGFGNVTIRRTDGVASAFMETQLSGAKEFSVQINQQLKKYRY